VKELFEIEIDEEILLEKDISKIIGPMSIYMNPKLTKDLSTEQKQLLKRIFLRIEHLDKETLKKIVETVDRIIKEENGES
jgi:hypothetical protein